MMLSTYLSCIIFILTYRPTLQESAKEDVVLTNGQWKFGQAVHKILSKEQGNILFSPLSLHGVLSLLYLGSAGSTKTALKMALGLSEVNDTAVAYKTLIGILKSRTNVTVEMATKIYAMDSLKLVDKFKTDSEEYFDSGVEHVNFKDGQKTANHINKWVAEKTHNKIKNIFKPDKSSPLIVLVLLNTLYFDGTWLHKFRLLQGKQKFYTSKTKTIDCSMMQLVDFLGYKKDTKKGFEYIRIPYEDTNLLFDLTIILPTSKTGLADLEKKFVSDPSFFDVRPESKMVQLTLPRFKIEKEIDLKSILSQLGLADMFRKVDISNMIETVIGAKPLKVDQVKQKVFFDVNENGTIASAATEVVIGLSSVRPDKLVHFTADHPFLFLLEMRVAGDVRHVLFQGRVVKPEYH